MAVEIPEKNIVEKIYVIRGQKIMLDRDLAEMYGVETKALKQAVKRNLSRFPADFMFTMTAAELSNWRSQIVTSNSSDRMGLRHAPFCFTEQGVAMLSSVLRSNTAIQVNIRIIRVFTAMRQSIVQNPVLLDKIEKMELKIAAHDTDLQTIFDTMKQMIGEPRQERDAIGFPYPNRK